jgi:hypothetical protein
MDDAGSRMIDEDAGEGIAVSPAAVEVIEVLAPAVQTLPIILASPHSGCRYPREFVAASRLDPLTLRKSEDSFVDEIFSAAPISIRTGNPMSSIRRCSRTRCRIG